MNTDDEIMPLLPTTNRNPFFVNISPIPRDEQIVEPANKYNGINKLYKSIVKLNIINTVISFITLVFIVYNMALLNNMNKDDAIYKYIGYNIFYYYLILLLVSYSIYVFVNFFLLIYILYMIGCSYSDKIVIIHLINNNISIFLLNIIIKIAYIITINIIQLIDTNNYSITHYYNNITNEIIIYIMLLYFIRYISIYSNELEILYKLVK